MSRSMFALRPVVVAVLLLSGTSCWFAPGTAGASRSRPPIVDRGMSATNSGIADSQDPLRSTGRSRTSIPRVGTLESKPFQLPQPLVSTTPQGLTVVGVRLTNQIAERTTRIELAIPHRRVEGDEHGIATLTARVIADAPRPASGHASLRDEITSLGGTLDVQVDGAVTRFVIGAHLGTWRKSMEHLIDAIRSDPGGASVESIQARTLVALSELHEADPVEGAVRWVASSATYDRHPIDALQDLTAAQIGRFHQAAYQPVGAVLAIAGAESNSVLVGAATRLAEPWLRGAAQLAPTPTESHKFLPGVMWASGKDDPNGVILIELPPASGAQAAAMMVAFECFVGPSGRLKRQVKQSAGTALTLGTPRWLSNGPTRILEIPARGDAELMGALFGSVGTALGSLLQSAPSRDDVKAAAQHVRVQVLREFDSPAHSLSSIVRTFLANPATPPSEVGATLAALEQPEGLDIDHALGEIATLLPTIVVCGGTPGEGVTGLVSLGELRGSRAHDVLTEDEPTQLRNATAYLQVSFQALGGADSLAAVRGYMFQATTITNRGPQASELVLFDHGQSRFRRRRTVLATTIDTVVKEDRQIESVGDQVIPLEPDEISLLLERARRHPVSLLAAAARGESQFKLIAIRRAGERSIAVLQRIDEGHPRLRMHIDVKSGLVRTVQSVDHLPGIGAVSITEHWRDYRASLGSVRVPFHKTTVIDDTKNGSLTIFSTFVPTEPPADAFQ